MRSSIAFPLAAFLLPTLIAKPLTFELRKPDRFVSQFGDTQAIFRPGDISIGPITIRFRGAAAFAKLEGDGSSAPSTYIRPGSIQTFRQFPRVAIRNVYPGIDAIFYGNGDQLEYDLLAAPHARMEQVEMIFEGARRIVAEKDGGLRIEAGAGLLEQRLPRVFQSNGKEVAAHYQVLTGNRVGIRLGRHDERLGLRIDPVLAYTRYFGGSATDSGSNIAVDARGNLYVAGRSNSVDFPTTNGVQPKLSPPLLAIANGGQTVTRLPIGAENSVLAIGGNSDGSVLYALTPDAVYVSSDHGADWERRTSPFNYLPVAAGQTVTVGALAVDPVDPSQIFLATSRGLLSSGTGGLQGWGVNETGLPVAGNGVVSASWVAVSPLNHQVLYATTSQPGGMYKTSNHGVSWQGLNPSVAGEMSNSSYPPIATIAPNGNDLYVVDAASNLVKSTDGGATWQPLAQGLFGTRSIALDPNAPNVYVADSLGLQVSHDGGMTFVTAPLPGGTSGNAPQSVVVDAATGAVYVAFPSAIYVSSDAGSTLQPVPQVFSSTPHTLVALGGQVYAGIDSPSTQFVMKLDPTGTQVLYSTFIGGSVADYASKIVVDAQGNCTLAGYTYSPDYPATTLLPNASPQSSPTAFITKLSADGTRLIYSTLIGASKGVSVQGLALDGSGAAYVTGQTPSPDFPTTPSAYQAALPTVACSRPFNFLSNVNPAIYGFVSKLTADGSALAYSTFLTGSCGSSGAGIAVDSSGEATVAGFTASADFPATANAYQAAFPGDPTKTSPPNTLAAGFVTKLSAAGDKVLVSSYLGGGYLTSANGVALDQSGNVSLAGATVAMALGATPGVFQPKPADHCVPIINIGPGPPPFGTEDAFVLKLDPGLTTALYMTYLGGACDDSAASLSLDGAGNAWVVGYTDSQDFPLRTPYEGQGVSNRFVSEISADGSQLLFSSGTDGAGLALDGSGAAYLVGSSSGGSTVSKMVQNGGFTGTSVELVKVDPSSTPVVAIDAIGGVTGYPPALPPPFVSGLAAGQLVQISGRNLGPSDAVFGQLDASGRLPVIVSNTSVYFDDIPSPLISVSAGSIECFAPFEINGMTNVTVVAGGQKSNAVRMNVQVSAVQILSIANQDGTLNSAGNPAHANSEIVIYASGYGETFPLSVDGLLNVAPLPVPQFPVVANVGGTAVTPQYAGAAPGMIAGIMQVNLALGAFPNNAVSVYLNGAIATLYVAP